MRVLLGPLTRASFAIRVVAVAVVAMAAFYGLLTWSLGASHGLTEERVQRGSSGETRLAAQRVRAIDVAAVEDRVTPFAGPTRLRWTGSWFVSASGLTDLVLEADGHAIWRIDGHLVHERAAGDGVSPRRTVLLNRGFHAFELEYERATEPARLVLAYGPPGGATRPLDPEDLFVTAPTQPRAWLISARVVLRWLIAVGALVVGVLASRRLARMVAARVPPAGPRARRAVGVALFGLVVCYAIVLRLDALTATYGLVNRPLWVHDLQTHVGGVAQGVKPGAMTWEPAPMYPHRDAPATRYYADSYTYLQFAREMRSFYRAHYREPLFPALTKAALAVLHDQDIAVSFVSGTFSVLVVVATYLLGTLAFSRGVGLAAALAIAIERDEISWGVSGWRDSAFTFAVVMFAWAGLKYFRAPSRRTALWMGMWAAVGCLLRITALSYVVPGGVAVLLAVGGPRKVRLREAGLAVLVLAVLVGPYLFNCWRAFGDPLYAINYHTGNYLTAEGAAPVSRPSAAEYVGAKIFDRPFGTMDTALLGVTSYPFLVKWHGFDPWDTWLGRGLSAAALLGFVALVGFPSGRLLLFVAFTSQLPFSVTWTVAPDWRFTEHVYPFFLIAAFVPVVLGLRGLWPIARAWPERLATSRYFWGSVACGIGLLAWLAFDVLPAGAVREAIARSDGGSIVAGARDDPFFSGPWSESVTEGNVSFRVPAERGAVVRLPLSGGQDYDLTLRMDPFPRPLRPVPTLPSVSVFVNDRLVSTQPLRWNPDRVGAYAVRVPGAVTKTGMNSLVLILDNSAAGLLTGGLPPIPGLSEGSALKVWLVRVRRSLAP